MPMYNPDHFRTVDHDQALAFIDQYDFAIVASHGELMTTHTPMTAARSGDSIKLFGHFARKNPHCERLDGRTLHTCVFAGPHTYVSPSWYLTTPAVPTWNYSAVHITGTACVIEDNEVLKQHMLAMVRKHDPQIDVEQLMPEKYMRGMMKGITGFILTASAIEMKLKHSQNRSREDQQAVVEHLSKSENHDALAVAHAMQRNLDNIKS